jgi:hypothetical protein
MIDLSKARWRKASASGNGGNGCVEVADNLRDLVALRDSTRPQLGVHVTTPAAFAAFVADAKHGRYDLACVVSSDVTAKPDPEQLAAAHLSWHRSGETADGVEIAFHRPWVLLRTADEPVGRASAFTHHEWSCFLTGTRAGEFDL